MSFEKLLSAGTSLAELPSEARSIRLANSIAFGLVFILTALALLRSVFFAFNPLIFVVILGNAICMLTPVVLNHRGYHSASRISLCWIFPILLIADAWIVLKLEGIRETSTYLGFRIFQVALAGLPLLIFPLKDLKKILLGFSVPLGAILFYDPLLSLLNIGYEEVGLSETSYHWNSFRTIVSVMFVCWSVYSLKKVIQQHEEQNAILIQQLNRKNKQIEFQAGKAIEMLNNELVQQLEQVTQAEKKYRMLFEEASDGIILCDVEGNFIDVNPYMCELLGYSRDELITKNYPSISDENESNLRSIIYEKLEIGVGITAERTFKTKDGRRITVEKRFKKIDEKPVKWIADEYCSYLVLNNIIRNAVVFNDAAKAERKVSIGVVVNETFAAIQIADNGIGISAEQQTRLFEPFHRASNLKTGLGLGLFLVKGMINKLRANICISSQADIGTTVSLIIPNNPLT